ncbi:MAG: hypothetical protein ACRERU_10215 [Methylococcales bacterium]
MPALRQRQQAVQAELQALTTQSVDQAACLRLAETLTAFLERLRENAETLDILERQRIMRLLVKEVIVGQDTITIKHSIPGSPISSAGTPASSESLESSQNAQSSESYLLRSWHDLTAAGEPLSALRIRPMDGTGTSRDSF